MRSNFELQRAKAIGRQLYQKYDIGKRGNLGPKQCYEIFCDYVFRILSINTPPTMQQADSMFQVLDENKDKRVTQSDFENLALKYLCGINNYGTSNLSGSTFTSNYGKASNVSSQSSNNRNRTEYSSSSNINNLVGLTPQTSQKKLTVMATRRLDVARRLFKQFDKDQNGYLEEYEVPEIIAETYREAGINYKVSSEDAKSYMKMVDTNKDGKISLEQFEEIILRSLKNAGIEIYDS